MLLTFAYALIAPQLFSSTAVLMPTVLSENSGHAGRGKRVKLVKKFPTCFAAAVG
jgi:hypothetical protein